MSAHVCARVRILRTAHVGELRTNHQTVDFVFVLNIKLLVLFKHALTTLFDNINIHELGNIHITRKYSQS